MSAVLCLRRVSVPRKVVTTEGIITINDADEDFEDNDVLDPEEEDEFDEDADGEGYYEEENPLLKPEEDIEDLDEE
jgi:hypothetical protein